MFVNLSSEIGSDVLIALPNIEWPDIFNYLVNSSSTYTFKTLKNYKSLEAYQYFVAGWVKEVHVRNSNSKEDIIIAVSKVNILKKGIFCHCIFQSQTAGKDIRQSKLLLKGAV